MRRVIPTLGKINAVVLTVGLIGILLGLPTSKMFPDFAKGVLFVSFCAVFLHAALFVATYFCARRWSRLYNDYFVAKNEAEDAEWARHRERLDEMIKEDPSIVDKFRAEMRNYNGGAPPRWTYIWVTLLMLGAIGSIVGSSFDYMHPNPYFYWSNIGLIVCCILLYQPYWYITLIYDDYERQIPDAKKWCEEKKKELSESE